jgi:hypothetical protein
MGFFTNLILDNGNTKVIAKSIATHFQRLGSFVSVVEFYKQDFEHRLAKGSGDAKLLFALAMIDAGYMHDMCDLGGLILWVDASPKNAIYDDILQTFRPPLARNFRKLGIDSKVAGEELREVVDMSSLKFGPK